MNNIRELTNFEIYEYIFKPIFKYNIDSLYPLWSMKDIINLKYEPKIYYHDHYPVLASELKNRLPQNCSHNFNSFEDIVDVLHKNGLTKEFKVPIFKIFETSTEIIIKLAHDLNRRLDFNCRGCVETFKTYDNVNYLILHKNGDISKSFYTSRESGMYNNYTLHDRFLSYTETLEMRKYFEDLDIDIINLTPIEYSI
jgi:hypothetical protein